VGTDRMSPADEVKEKRFGLVEGAELTEDGPFTGVGGAAVRMRSVDTHLPGWSWFSDAPPRRFRKPRGATARGGFSSVWNVGSAMWPVAPHVGVP
jgi:hypothetical protein